MKLGLFTPVLGSLPFEKMLEKVRSLQRVQAIELGTGAWPGSDHIKVDELLGNAQKAKEFRSKIQDTGLTISALSCHGNPIHPEAAVAKKYDETFRKTVRLAEKLEVPVVVTFSGCPGDKKQGNCPNWIVAPWPPEFLETLTWQWEKKVIPYWKNAGKFAADHGIKVALEAHPGFVVYNVETALKLRAAAGKSIGVNFDPSHFFWQGVDVPVAIRALGEAIFHVHAKDVALSDENIRKNGVLDAKSYREMPDRAWLFRSVGWGHGELEWKRIVSALRLSGYDYVMSIEHEDALASADQGLSFAVEFLSRLLLAEQPAEPWWT